MTDAPVNSEMTDQELLEIEVKELVGLQAQSLFSPHHPDQECGLPGRSNAMTDTPAYREALERITDDELLAQINRFDPYDVEFVRRYRALLDAKESAEAEREDAYARGYHDCQQRGITEGRLVLLDGPELLAAKVEIAKLRDAAEAERDHVLALAAAERRDILSELEMGAHVANLRGTALERKAWGEACALVADRDDDDASAALESRERLAWNDAVRAAASHCENLRGLGFADAGGAIPTRVGEAVAQTIRAIPNPYREGQDQ